jgi:hypothetical protein
MQIVLTRLATPSDLTRPGSVPRLPNDRSLKEEAVKEVDELTPEVREKQLREDRFSRVNAYVNVLASVVTVALLVAAVAAVVAAPGGSGSPKESGLANATAAAFVGFSIFSFLYSAYSLWRRRRMFLSDGPEAWRVADKIWSELVSEKQGQDRK